MIEADLYFGRSTADGLVSEEDWQRFVDTEITPRFPGGFTIQDTSGQWKAEGGIVREPSKRLVVVMPAGSRNQAKLEALREAYKARFKQDSVLLLETSTCGSF